VSGEVQSIDEAWVTTDNRQGFLFRTSIVANPEGWFCQAGKICVVARAKLESLLKYLFYK